MRVWITPPGDRRRAEHLDPTLVLVPVFALVSMVGALFPSFSVGANVLVLVTGAALFWLGLSTRLPRGVHRIGCPRTPAGGCCPL